MPVEYTFNITPSQFVYDWEKNMVVSSQAITFEMCAPPKPKRIIRNGPALIVFWDDGTKTVVKCHDEGFDGEKGLAMALARKLWNRSQTVKYVKSIEEQEGQ